MNTTFEREMIETAAEVLADPTKATCWVPARFVDEVAERFRAARPGLRLLVGVVDGKAGPEAVQRAAKNTCCWMTAEVRR